MVRDACLYFHSPCFDGITSSVLTLDFLETSQDWTFKELRPVNYDQRNSWLSEEQERSRPFAVVDYLYHPSAEFWADHHQTSFLTPELKKQFCEHKSPFHIYNSKSGSCAMLLWRVLWRRFKYQNSRYSELVSWADKIDAARYSSVEEAILGSNPAITVSRSLAINKDPNYSVWLVTRLRRYSLEEVGSSPEVVEKSNEVLALITAGLERLSKTVHLEDDNIAIFDVDSSDVLVNRYSPYHFYPKARYSLGIVRKPDSIKITAMRNPWRHFPSVYLGRLFERFGGGGHRRVGSLLLRGSDAQDPEMVLRQLLTEIRNEESRNKKRVAA
jgi:hypothetical protein